MRLRGPVDPYEPGALVLHRAPPAVGVAAMPNGSVPALEGANSPRGLHRGQSSGHGSPQVLEAQGMAGRSRQVGPIPEQPTTAQSGSRWEIQGADPFAGRSGAPNC